METLLIVLVVLVPLAISGVVVAKIWKSVLAPLLGQQGEQKRILSVGVQCPARVRHVEQTGMTLEMGGVQSHRLRLVLDVLPAALPPYQAETIAMVSILAFPRVQPGCIVTVRYDPADPRKVAMEAAYPPGQAPGQALPNHGMPGPAYGGAPQRVPFGQPGGYPPGPQPPGHSPYSGPGGWRT